MEKDVVVALISFNPESCREARVFMINQLGFLWMFAVLQLKM
jgi:hypothetical protein